MKIKMKLKNDLGEFDSEIMEVNEDQLQGLIDVSKGFYTSGYEMYTTNGFMVVGPEILKKSILFIEILTGENGIEK
jgi:hypothetical protein